MKNLNNLVFLCITLMIWILVFSCSNDNDGLIKEEEQIKNMLNGVSTDWNKSSAEIVSLMKGYSKRYTPTNDELFYEDKNNDIQISYCFKNDELIASAVVFKSSEHINRDNILKGYEYIGELSSHSVYANVSQNTIASYQEISTDGKIIIGFAPIDSHNYEYVKPYNVSTSDEYMLSPCSVKLFGTVNGSPNQTEAGFILGLSSELKDDEVVKSSVEVSQGEYSIEFTGILDEETYYYQAYAVIDDIMYKGDIRTFKTPTLSYTINGKEFRMIKVEGGPYGTFSMMQTELCVSDVVSIGGKPLDIILDNDVVDNKITKYEFKQYFKALRNLTGHEWRMASSSEWKLASFGGTDDELFIYSGGNNIEDVAWYAGNCTGPQDPGLKSPNGLGFYDMSGNYREMTLSDTFFKEKDNSYSIILMSDWWISGGSWGGCWKDSASKCKKNSCVEVEELSFNVLDGNVLALRLVYSHDPGFKWK